MFLIIGTSHIAKQSIKQIKSAVSSFKPDIVAVELDYRRYKSLLSIEANSKAGLKGKNARKKGFIKQLQKLRLLLPSIKKYGLTGFLFAVFAGYVSKKLGKIVGVIPGEDMLTALKEAKKAGIRAALIDQDLEITLARVSAEFTFKQKLRLVYDILRSFVSPPEELKIFQKNAINLASVPEEIVIEGMLSFFKSRYNGLYRALIEERNLFMAKRIAEIAKSFAAENNKLPKVLIVVGAGHKKGLEQLLGNKLSKQDSLAGQK